MRRSTGTILYSYAAMLLVIGLFSAFYNAQHQLGWNVHGKTGLIACGIGAVLAAVFAFLNDKGLKWTLWAGLILSFLFLCTGGKNAFLDGRAWSAGDQEKWFRAVVFGLTLLVSLRTFVMLGLNARHTSATADSN